MSVSGGVLVVLRGRLRSLARRSAALTVVPGARPLICTTTLVVGKVRGLQAAHPALFRITTYCVEGERGASMRVDMQRLRGSASSAV